MLLVAGCLVLFSTLLIESQHRRCRRPGAERALRHRVGRSGVSTAAASPATRSLAASSRSSTGGWTAWTQTAAPAPTATWRQTTSSSRRPTPRRGSSASQRRRQRNPDADDPLFRPIDADDFRTNGENASDFSNLRQNGLVRITFPLPSNIKLVDPATNAPSAETFVDVWRSVPTVNDVALTGPDGVNPWPRGPNASGGYQLDARVTTLQEQALGALTNHAQVQNAPPQRLLDDLASFQRVLFTNHRVRALADAIREGTTPLPDPDPPLNELEQQGKVVFERACAQCHGGPGQSTPQAPVVRFHDISSQCPRPVDTVTPARFAFAPCPPRLARNARTYEITLANGTKTRRTSSDPGRALLTGFVGGVPAQDDWNKFDVPGLRGHQQDRPVLPQQQRRHPRGGRRSLHRVLQARAGECGAGCRAADR